MLGERRSKAAFSAGFPEAVREETRQDYGNGGFFGWLGWRGGDRRKPPK